LRRERFKRYIVSRWRAVKLRSSRRIPHINTDNLSLGAQSAAHDLRLFRHFQFAHLVHGVVDHSSDIAAVEADLSMRRLCGDTLDVCLAHIHADMRDSLRLVVMGDQIDLKGATVSWSRPSAANSRCVVVDTAPQAMDRYAQQPSGLGHAHRLTQRHGQGFEQQGGNDCHAGYAAFHF
jgi:hypothetical protein